jgi:EAL domain-containing protein (putative c-di-GMP-specific phosphodiesterase class I)
MFSRGIGSKVVAEGIESRGEAMVLSRNKVVLVQGYNSAGQSIIVMLPISS